MLKDKKKTIAIAAVVAALALIIGCGAQQDTKLQDDAVALAVQGDQAMTSLEWTTYSSMIDPDDLQKFKAMILLELERLAMMRKSDSITVIDQAFALVDLREAPPEQFFNDMMTVIFRVSQDLNRSFTGMKNDFIGAVPENDSTIHVVAHTKMLVGTRHVDEMNVTTLRKIDDEWKLAISNKLQGVGYMLVESLQMQR